MYLDGHPQGTPGSPGEGEWGGSMAAGMTSKEAGQPLPFDKVGALSRNLSRGTRFISVLFRPFLGLSNTSTLP